MSDVWVKIKIPEDLHGKFRLWSFENRCSMQGAILDWVEKACGVKPPTVDRKQVKVKPDVQTEGYVAVIRRDAPEPIPMAKCSKCFDTFPVADMVTDPKSGKLFCGDCVANMRNQQ